MWGWHPGLVTCWLQGQNHHPRSHSHTHWQLRHGEQPIVLVLGSARVPGENLQTPPQKVGIQLAAFLLWGDSANHCNQHTVELINQCSKRVYANMHAQIKAWSSWKTAFFLRRSAKCPVTQWLFFCFLTTFRYVLHKCWPDNKHFDSPCVPSQPNADHVFPFFCKCHSLVKRQAKC